MTQAYRVELTATAHADIIGIHDQIARDYSPDAADAFLDKVEEAITDLEIFPNRGSIPRELEGFGLPLRQRHIGAYRAVYRVVGQAVFILFVVHLKQSLQPIVARRVVKP